MLRLRNITKDYTVAGQAVPALKGVTVNFRANEFVSVLGPSGCGKTTLLNIIGGLDKYSGGDLIIDGRSTKSFGDRDWDVYRNHRIGFIFQSYNLIPHQTVLGNVELALTIAGMSKAARREKAAEALRRVGLGDQLNKRPNQLSGGQCQRVAIARALVNDPEILLADEPTGALDTATSVQIMDLMKEIAGERLVIMVTHNPELAEKYSTRIINLRDGLIVGDSMPYSDEEEEAECAKRLAAKSEAEAKAKEDGAKEGGKTKVKPEKAKMGFLTALSLSLRNLMAKKGRTIMVGIAGSIGIIGVAIVLAFSTGISNYIYQMETDMLSGYPVSVAESAVDYSQLISMTLDLATQEEETGREPNKVYVNKIVEAMTSLSGSTVTNNITQEYLDFVEAMPAENYETLQYTYGINFANNIYTEYKFEDDATAKDSSGETIPVHKTSITGVRSIFTGVLGHIEEYAAYTSIISSISTFGEVPDKKDYILSQYDIVAGEYPEQSDKGALVLALTGNDEMDDLILAQFGYVSAREFVNYAFSLAKEGAHTYSDFYQKDLPHMEKPFEYSDFVGPDAKTFTWYPNSLVYEVSGTATEGDRNPSQNKYIYNTYADKFSDSDDENIVEMSVRCILKPKEGVQYGMLSSGLYYTKALTDHVRNIELNEKTRSPIVQDALDSSREGVVDVTYSYDYYYDEYVDKSDPSQGIVRDVHGSEYNVGFGATVNDVDAGAITSLLTRDQFVNVITDLITQSGGDVSIFAELLANMLYGSSDKVVYLGALGGSELPSRIRFWASDFKQKDAITAYLDEWNEPDNGHVWKTDSNGQIVYNDKGEKVVDETKTVQYTDILGVIMTMVNQLIMMITAALIVFTSIALVVSTVMIGIITYVSVVERTKEIGVIRAMGGSKLDVRNLFNAETFIIGLIAGIIGIVVTYILSLVANLIIGGFTGIYTIASLQFWQALIMITISVALTLISGLIPASKAAKKDPVVALRTE